MRAAPVPPGTFDKVGIDVNTVPSTAAGNNAVLQALAAEHASIIVDGFVAGSGTTTPPTPFSFETPMHVRQVREGTIVIGEGTNITLDFDPTGWFVGRDGATLNPNDPTARGEILANIRASIRIIKDDDHDGVDDDQDGNSQGGGGNSQGHGGMGHGD